LINIFCQQPFYIYYKKDFLYLIHKYIVGDAGYSTNIICKKIADKSYKSIFAFRLGPLLFNWIHNNEQMKYLNDVLKLLADKECGIIKINSNMAY
jgi:hypothetical protein